MSDSMHIVSLIQNIIWCKTKRSLTRVSFGSVGVDESALMVCKSFTEMLLGSVKVDESKLMMCTPFTEIPLGLEEVDESS